MTIVGTIYFINKIDILFAKSDMTLNHIPCKYKCEEFWDIDLVLNFRGLGRVNKTSQCFYEMSNDVIVALSCNFSFLCSLCGQCWQKIVNTYRC